MSHVIATPASALKHVDKGIDAVPRVTSRRTQYSLRDIPGAVEEQSTPMLVKISKPKKLSVEVSCNTEASFTPWEVVHMTKEISDEEVSDNM